MANYALVIGCDRYWDEPSRLDGAVRDALAMRSWLLDLDGGAVPPQNMTLLLTPSDRSEVPPRLTRVPEATRAAVVQAADDLLRRSDGDQGTLYFYFAGHGLTALVGGFDEPCLLPSDFLPRYRDPAVPIRDLLDQLAVSTLSPQFLFVDACRGVPTDRNFRAVGISDRRPRDYSRAEPDQYVRFATSAGKAAYETGARGMANGQFTAALLRGLRGAGTAKRWDPDHEQYVVRLRELSGYVRSELAGAGVTQVPRAEDRHDDANPVLTRLPESAFNPVRLTMRLAPNEAAADTTVAALGPDDRILVPPLPNPLVIALAPRTYSIRTFSPSFTAGRKSWMVDLYQDTALTIDLEPAVRPGTPPAWLYERPVCGIERAARTETPALQAPDPYAVVERVDDSGAVEFFAGGVEFERAGRYRLRVVEPHGGGPVSVTEVGRRSADEIALSPPEAPRLAARLASDAGFSVRSDGFWLPPSGLRPMAPLSPAAVAGVAALSALAGREHSLGLELPGGAAGLVLIVVDAEPNLARRVAAGAAGLAPVVVPQCHDHVAAAVLSLPFGSTVVEVDGLFDRRLAVAGYVPSREPGILVIDRSEPGSPAVLSYPTVRGSISSGIDALVRSDRAQRFAARGHISAARAVLRTGPAGVAGTVLSGLLAARAGAAGAADVARAVAALRTDAPRLPDAAVLESLARAGSAPVRGRPRMRPPELSGLPIFASALTAAAALHGDAEPGGLLAGAVAGLLPGQPGSAWFTRRPGTSDATSA